MRSEIDDMLISMSEEELMQCLNNLRTIDGCNLSADMVTNIEAIGHELYRREMEQYMPQGGSCSE